MAKQTCFVDMPFGKKTDVKSGVEIDFDHVYEAAIRPAIEEEGLEAIRGDRERSGGIIHTAMFARLLLSEFVVADMTTSNANVFYELGVRHTARPYTTIPIFATIGGPPFDVSLVRAIPYDLDNGKLSDEAAEKLKEEIKSRLRYALQGPTNKDSPLFQLFDRFPGIDMSHELTDVFRERVDYSRAWKDKLEDAREAGSNEQKVEALQAIETELGDLLVVEHGVLVDLFLSYRDVEAWNQMIDVYEKLPAELRESVMIRQQRALALGRRNQGTDRKRAARELRQILDEFGESAETLGLLGRVHKDLYREAKKDDKLEWSKHLDDAIHAYTRGFECEPLDYYPGVNALNLLLQKGTEDALKEVDRLSPLVTFAVSRQGGLDSEDYWTVATVLELALIGRDEQLANQALPRVVGTDAASWMYTTTAANLEMILKLDREGEITEALTSAIEKLQAKARDVAGNEE